MTKVYIVVGGYDYEGYEVIYVASTKEGAKKWMSLWTQYYPFLEDEWLKNLQKWKREGYFVEYDYMRIIEMPVDVEDVSKS